MNPPDTPTAGAGTDPPDYQELFRQFKGQEGELISILVRVQETFGYISEESVRQISQFLRLSENQIFGVASFFSKFRFDEPGRKSIKVCMGTACHVHGGGFLSDTLGWQLGITVGQSTKDKRFDFQRVNCLGCCALAPVVQINEKIHARTMVTQLKEILQNRE
ncbi:MAG TPA: NAD(P)H-dependent oxidoreductase subunit E [Acidobacteriota bacterium]|nr:NAD(P)H-dependent oxidoreductase subunit E [Acidobacteriota bacterium]HQM62733.1 NAD(P)H-dependent oxidoreductase subunit E [Acidobacteriota bacterium]